MSIEKEIADNTAAVKENTAVLKELVAVWSRLNENANSIAKNEKATTVNAAGKPVVAAPDAAAPEQAAAAPAQVPPAAGSALTQAEVSKRTVAFAGEHGPDKARAILAQFNVKAARELVPAQYDAFVAALDAVVGAA